MKGYLDYLTQICRMGRVEAIHKYFPSLLDTVPSQDYGEYLIVNELDSMRFIPYKTMKVKNLFLDKLNRCQDLIQARSIEVTLIAGIGKSTIQYLQNDRSSLTQLWDIDTAWSTINSQAGDGNVIVSSVFVLDEDQHLVEGGHMGALFSSYPFLKRKIT